MALALEGTPKHVNSGSGSSVALPAFTTTVATQVFIAVTVNSATVSSITGGSLTWTKRKSTGQGSPVELWTAPAASALSSVVFTVNLSISSSFCTCDVFAFSGNDTSTIWDGNASVPASQTTADPIAETTNNANDVLIGAFRMNTQGNPTAGTGFTLISGANFQLCEYQIVSSSGAQSLTIGTGVGDANGCIADAMMAAAASTSTVLPVMMFDNP